MRPLIRFSCTELHLSERRIARRGAAVLYLAVILTVLGGFVSLAIDYGRVQVAKSQLASAADAAARAGARDLSNSVASAQSSAVAVAAGNLCDGASIVLDINNDIEFGNWNVATSTFTVLTGNARSTANALRVTARRATARGNPISLTWARLVGRDSIDLSASAIALVTTSSVSGFQGLNGITFKNNAFFGSYLPSTTLYPTHTSARSNALLASNGVIDAGNNGAVKGNVQVGPAGSIDAALSVTGTRTTLANPLPTPTTPAWTPAINPGGVPQNYTVNSSTTLPAGTYWFTSLNVQADLTFYGPATIYVNGNITVDAALTGSGRLPANLTIYQLGANRTFGDSGSNAITIAANVVAPGSDFVAKNNMDFLGSAIFETITCKNNADFYYDESSGAASGSTTTKLVK